MIKKNTNSEAKLIKLIETLLPDASPAAVGSSMRAYASCSTLHHRNEPMQSVRTNSETMIVKNTKFILNVLAQRASVMRSARAAFVTTVACVHNCSATRRLARVISNA